MTGAVAQVECRNGAEELYCPRCAHQILGEEGLADAWCPHLLFVVDWIGELNLPASVDTSDGNSIARRLRELWDEDAPTIEDGVARLAAALPESAFVLSIFEPARGGGHDGSIVWFGFDLSTIQ